MRKLLFVAMLGMFSATCLTSCGREDGDPLRNADTGRPFTEKTQAARKDGKILYDSNGHKVTAKEGELNEDEKEALALVEKEVTLIIETKNSTGRVKMCTNHSPYGLSEGQGYAEVTLGNPNVHYYTFYTWYTTSDGTLHTQAIFLGNSPRDYMGC